MLNLGEIARLAAEEARKEQNRLDGGGVGRAKPTLTTPAKEKVGLWRKFEFQTIT